MKQLNSRQTAWAFIGGALLTLAGVMLVGVLLNATWSTGDISGVLAKAGWFGAAGIPAMVASGWFFLRVALRREWSGLAAKRVMTGIAALFLLAFLFIEWVPMARRDNSVDTDELLEQSRETFKQVDSEMERIKSETGEAILAEDDLEAKAKQPNTIYAKTEFGDFAYENLLVLKLLKRDDEWFLVSDRHIERVTKKTASEDSAEVPMRHFGLFLLTEDFRGHIGPGDVSGPVELGTHEMHDTKHALGHLAAETAKKRGFAVVAFKAELWLWNPDESDALHPRFNHGANYIGGMTDISERKAFVDKLHHGESGEFGGWHYLKVDRWVSEDSGAEE